MCGLLPHSISSEVSYRIISSDFEWPQWPSCSIHIMWEWTKLGAMHIQAQVFSRLLQSSLWVNMVLVHCFHLCSQPYKLQHTVNLLPFSQSGAVSDTLRIYRFCAIVATCVLASITSSEQRGWDSVHAHLQASHVCLVSMLDIMHVMKCTRLSPSLAGRTCGWV